MPRTTISVRLGHARRLAKCFAYACARHFSVNVTVTVGRPSGVQQSTTRPTTGHFTVSVPGHTDATSRMDGSSALAE